MSRYHINKNLRFNNTAAPLAIYRLVRRFAIVLAREMLPLNRHILHYSSGGLVNQRRLDSCAYTFTTSRWRRKTLTVSGERG